MINTRTLLKVDEKHIVVLKIGGKIMENNDILIRLRYALEIKNSEMAEIFKLGGKRFLYLK